MPGAFGKHAGSRKSGQSSVLLVFQDSIVVVCKWVCLSCACMVHKLASHVCISDFTNLHINLYFCHSVITHEDNDTDAQN